MEIVIDIDYRCIPQNARPIDWIKSAYENPSKCKITVLHKHGRLIDADELPLDIDYADIENAPTILGTNEAESED